MVCCVFGVLTRSFFAFRTFKLISPLGQFFELLTGDYLFDPQPGTKYDKDDDHVAQIMELLGDMPKALALSGKYSHEMFNRRGEFKSTNTPPPLSLPS